MCNMITTKRVTRLIPFLILIVLALASIFLAPQFQPGKPVPFDGNRAYADVEFQVSLGPRTPGSDAHQQFITWSKSRLEQNQWKVEVQTTSMENKPITNIIAKRGSGHPWIILGAHYDSRLIADDDPEPTNRTLPVPGANDGASGVAVLLELARDLPSNLEKQVWLVFFDSEDQGRIPGWDWILGSRAFVQNIKSKPDSVIIIDMIGDKNLNIYLENNSNAELSAEIWKIAAEKGYQNQFIITPKYSILDDHIPFLEQGIRAIDIIDFDYPYWHTIQDTPDKVSAESLSIIGSVLLDWIQQ
jgi:glutaminyl-peptide cyclotransferase